MNLAHEADLLLMEEWTVIDERRDVYRPVFSLSPIEKNDTWCSCHVSGDTVGRDYFFLNGKLPLKTAV
jgi:hypothetical protein